MRVRSSKMKGDLKVINNIVAIELPGGNRIRRINIKAQHSAFSRAINRPGFIRLYMFIKSDVSS